MKIRAACPLPSFKYFSNLAGVHSYFFAGIKIFRLNENSDGRNYGTLLFFMELYYSKTNL
jgi:hypothetical protein